MSLAIGIVGVLAIAFMFWCLTASRRRPEKETGLEFDPVAHDRNVVFGRTNGAVRAGQLVSVTIPTPGIANHRAIAGGAPARSIAADNESAALMLEFARTELTREATPAERASPLFAEMEKVADGGWVGSSPTLHHHDEVHAQLSPPEVFTAADLSPSHDSTPSYDSSPSSSFDGGSSDSGGSSGGDW